MQPSRKVYGFALWKPTLQVCCSPHIRTNLNLTGSSQKLTSQAGCIVRKHYTPPRQICRLNSLQTAYTAKSFPLKCLQSAYTGQTAYKAPTSEVPTLCEPPTKCLHITYTLRTTYKVPTKRLHLRCLQSAGCKLFLPSKWPLIFLSSTDIIGFQSLISIPAWRPPPGIGSALSIGGRRSSLI